MTGHLDTKQFCTWFIPSETAESAVATIVIRGASDNILDDIERAVDDGVNTFKALTRVCSCPLGVLHNVDSSIKLLPAISCQLLLRLVHEVSFIKKCI